MTFEFVPKRQFFDLLARDPEFCEGVGRVMLFAGMLETNLRQHLEETGLAISQKATLGNMVSMMKKEELLSRNGEMHFDDLKVKRNYLAHNLYALFSEEIEETILPREELVKEDIHLFRERALQLAEEFLYFAKLVDTADPTESVLL